MGRNTFYEAIEIERFRSKGCISGSSHYIDSNQMSVKTPRWCWQRQEQISARDTKRKDYLQKATVKKSVSHVTESAKKDLQNFHAAKSLVDTTVSYPHVQGHKFPLQVKINNQEIRWCAQEANCIKSFECSINCLGNRDWAGKVGGWFKGGTEHLWIIIDTEIAYMHRTATIENMTQITNRRCGSWRHEAQRKWAIAPSVFTSSLFQNIANAPSQG